MTCAIKVDPKKLPAPRLAPSYSKRVRVADSFDRHIAQMTERQERLYNWRNDHQKSTGKRERTPSVWTDRRVAELVRLAEAGKRSGEIADRLHLSQSQVKSKMSDMRKKGQLPPPPPPKNAWKEEENAKLISLYQQGYTAEEIAPVIGRTTHAVGSQIHNLRKRGVSIPARPDIHRKPTYGCSNN